MVDTAQRLTDAEFVEELRSYLKAKVGFEQRVLTFHAASGAIDREKTLANVLYADIPPAKKDSLL